MRCEEDSQKNLTRKLSRKKASQKSLFESSPAFFKILLLSNFPVKNSFPFLVPTSSRSKAARTLNTKLSCPFVRFSAAAAADGVLCFWGFHCFYSWRAWGCWSRLRVMPGRRSPTHRRCFASATCRTCPTRPSTTTTTTTKYSRLLNVALCCCCCCWCCCCRLLKAFECFAADTSDTASVAAAPHPTRLQMMPKLEKEIESMVKNLFFSLMEDSPLSPLTRLVSLVPMVLMVLLLYRWLTRFDGVLIWGKIVNGVMGWDRWYFCIICCWFWSFSFNWSRLCFISDEADVDDVMMNVEEALLGWSHSWWIASSGVIRFFGSHLMIE